MTVLKDLGRTRDSRRRPARVADAIQRELSTLLLDGIKDPRLIMVSFTSVKVTDDLSRARVYYSCPEEDVAEVAAGLERAKGFMRSHIARELSLRYAPELVFERDLTLVRMAEIEKLLAEGKKE